MRIRHGLAAGSNGTSRSTPSRTSCQCTCLNINLIAVGQVRSGQVRSVVLLGRSLRPCGHAGSLPILGYPVTKMLAHMLARAVDFRPSRNGDGTVPAAAHSLRACRGAIARRRRQFADLGLSGHTNACTCQWWRAWSMQSIIDCRKAVPLLREHVGESWCGGTDCLLTSGIRSYRGLHACWRGWSTGPIFDCRETETGLCPWPRTVCECVGERWSDEAG